MIRSQLQECIAGQDARLWDTIFTK